MDQETGRGAVSATVAQGRFCFVC